MVSESYRQNHLPDTERDNIMKKFIAIVLACIIISSFAAVSSGATVLARDDFSSVNETLWRWDGTLFEVTPDGYLEGYSECVVQQTFYEDGADALDMPGWAQFTAWIDVMPLEPDRDGNHAAGLWYGDYGVLATGESAERDMYLFLCNFDTGMFTLTYNNEDVNSTDPAVMLGSWQGPEVEWGKSVIKMGIRVENGKLSCFVDGQEVITYSKASFGTLKTPVLLWNRNNHIRFDNFGIGDLDELKAAAPATDTTAPEGNDTAAPVKEPETSVVTKVETDTDAEGNTVTKIVSEVVTVAPADTNTNGTAGGTGAQTGDMVAIVAAVMIVALGSAVIVKKFSAEK